MNRMALRSDGGLIGCGVWVFGVESFVIVGCLNHDHAFSVIPRLKSVTPNAASGGTTYLF